MNKIQFKFKINNINNNNIIMISLTLISVIFLMLQASGKRIFYNNKNMKSLIIVMFLKLQKN